MATKLATRMYQVSSTETLNLTVAASGLPFYVRAALDDTNLPLVDRAPFPIRPRDLHGVDAFHLIALRLFFPDLTATKVAYTITVADPATTTTLETLSIEPTTGINPARVSLELWVV